MKTLCKYASLACLVTVGMSTANANMLANGSFETAASTFSQPGPSGTSLAAGTASATAIAGWSALTPPSVGFRDIAWLNNANIYGLSAQDGSDFLDLTGYSDEAPYAGIGQTVSGLVVGSQYRLSFYVGAGNDSGNPIFYGPAGVSLTVTDGNPTSTSSTYVTPSTFAQPWTLETDTFTATTTSAFIAFYGASAAGGDYIGLDNADLELIAAVVTPPPTGAVPEPETFALFPVGLIGWAAARRRKRPVCA